MGCQGKTASFSRVRENFSGKVVISRLECAVRECQNRQRWKDLSCINPLEESSHVGAGSQKYR